MHYMLTTMVFEAEKSFFGAATMWNGKTPTRARPFVWQGCFTSSHHPSLQAEGLPQGELDHGSQPEQP